MKTLKDVKPCPYCNSQPKMKYYYVSYDYGSYTGRVISCDCGHMCTHTEEQSSRFRTIGSKLTKRAKDEWNKECENTLESLQKALTICDICNTKTDSYNTINNKKYCPQCYKEYNDESK